MRIKFKIKTNISKCLKIFSCLLIKFFNIERKFRYELIFYLNVQNIDLKSNLFKIGIIFEKNGNFYYQKFLRNKYYHL